MSLVFLGGNSVAGARYSQRINFSSFEEVNRHFARFGKKLQAAKAVQVMLTTGNVKLNDAAKQPGDHKEAKGENS